MGDPRITIIMSKEKFKKLAEYDDGTVIYEEETREIKRSTLYSLFDKGHYSCSLSIPVPTTGWTVDGWINWINKTGRWWLDDCFWEYTGEGEYISTRSSGFLNRWNAEVEKETQKYKA